MRRCSFRGKEIEPKSAPANASSPGHTVHRPRRRHSVYLRFLASSPICLSFFACSFVIG